MNKKMQGGESPDLNALSMSCLEQGHQATFPQIVANTAALLSEGSSSLGLDVTELTNQLIPSPQSYIIYPLMGPSDAGKSTTLNRLLGMPERVPAGQSATGLTQTIGFVFNTYSSSLEELLYRMSMSSTTEAQWHALLPSDKYVLEFKQSATGARLTGVAINPAIAQSDPPVQHHKDLLVRDVADELSAKIQRQPILVHDPVSIDFNTLEFGTCLEELNKSIDLFGGPHAISHVDHEQLVNPRDVPESLKWLGDKQIVPADVMGQDMDHFNRLQVAMLVADPETRCGCLMLRGNRLTHNEESHGSLINTVDMLRHNSALHIDIVVLGFRMQEGGVAGMFKSTLELMAGPLKAKARGFTRGSNSHLVIQADKLKARLIKRASLTEAEQRELDDAVRQLHSKIKACWDKWMIGVVYSMLASALDCPEVSSNMTPRQLENLPEHVKEKLQRITVSIIRNDDDEDILKLRALITKSASWAMAGRVLDSVCSLARVMKGARQLQIEKLELTKQSLSVSEDPDPELVDTLLAAAEPIKQSLVSEFNKHRASQNSILPSSASALEAHLRQGVLRPYNNPKSLVLALKLHVGKKVFQEGVEASKTTDLDLAARCAQLFVDTFRQLPTAASIDSSILKAQRITLASTLQSTLKAALSPEAAAQLDRKLVGWLRAGDTGADNQVRLLLGKSSLKTLAVLDALRKQGGRPLEEELRDKRKEGWQGERSLAPSRDGAVALIASIMYDDLMYLKGCVEAHMDKLQEETLSGVDALVRRLACMVKAANMPGGEKLQGKERSALMNWDKKVHAEQKRLKSLAQRVLPRGDHRYQAAMALLDPLVVHSCSNDAEEPRLKRQRKSEGGGVGSIAGPSYEELSPSPTLSPVDPEVEEEAAMRMLADAAAAAEDNLDIAEAGEALNGQAALMEHVEAAGEAVPEDEEADNADEAGGPGEAAGPQNA